MIEYQMIFYELKDKLLSAGLSSRQSAEYVCFIENLYREDMKLGHVKAGDILPSDTCLVTLAEAQRIVSASAMNKLNPRELSVFEIHRYLNVPVASWSKAKAFIGEFFQRKETAVNAVYAADERWLIKTAEECKAVAHYLNLVCLNNLDFAWKIFQYAGLLGREKTEERINGLVDLLGYEDSFKLIQLDLHHNGWLFYPHDHANPVNCVAYLKQCGLSNTQILELISREGYILHLFNRTNAQAKIDSIIDRFEYDWVKLYGPCYDGLTSEEIAFHIHGPGKLEA